MSPWLNIRRAAEHLGVCRDTMREIFNGGELKISTKLGPRNRRTKAEWLDAYMTDREAEVDVDKMLEGLT